MISNENLNLNNQNKNSHFDDGSYSVPTENWKIYVLDTVFFINRKPLNLAEGSKYFTTEYIVKEIKDESAREYYNLNKEFIITRNPSREVMKLGKYYF